MSLGPERYEPLSDSPFAMGGFSSIYAALDQKRGVNVALKVPQTRYCLDDPDKTFSQAEREARFTARSNHPHIIQLYDFYQGPHPRRKLISGLQEKAVPIMVLQLFDPDQSPTLETIIGKKPLELQHAANYMEQCADAIDKMAENDILILDLKPANIIIDHVYGAVILDLGLVQGVVETEDGFIIGSPNYLSPEQVIGELCEIDLRSVVFAFGIVLYESITGELPFGKKGDGPTQRMASIALDPFNKRALNKITNKRARHNLIQVFEKALAKEKEDRYPTTLKLTEDFKKAIS